MTKETTYAGMLGDWQKLLDAMQVESTDLQYLEPQRTRLGGVLAQALALSKEQSTFKAEKQLRSQQLEVLIGNGRRLATGLRSELKNHYGIDSGKLAQFNLKPFQGRQTAAARRRREAARSSPPAQEGGAPES